MILTRGYSALLARLEEIAEKPILIARGWHGNISYNVIDRRREKTSHLKEASGALISARAREFMKVEAPARSVNDN